MRLRILLLTVFMLTPVVPTVLADTPTVSNTETRAERQARYLKEAEAQIARDDAVVERGEQQNQEIREQHGAEMEAGKAKAEEYARNHPVDGFENTEVRIQENWDATTDPDAYELHWQYRLVYTDSFGNPQYEAYFDEQGNVTTPLRESPERVAERRVQEALGDDDDGPFTVAWSFSEDNQGRQYPESVIVQGDGAINRVQMRFNEDGTPWFWDIRDEDGERSRYGTGLNKPTYGDDGPALATVDWPRPATGPCEKCRSLLEARNDILLELVPLGNEVNRLAGVHAKLNELAVEEELHVQKFPQYRQDHARVLRRFRRLESQFTQADSAWRACEQSCVKAADAEESALALPSPLAVNVVQDSAQQCTFGDPDGPQSLLAQPINNSAVFGPVAPPDSGAFSAPAAGASASPAASPTNRGGAGVGTPADLAQQGSMGTPTSDAPVPGAANSASGTTPSGGQSPGPSIAGAIASSSAASPASTPVSGADGSKSSGSGHNVTAALPTAATRNDENSAEQATVPSGPAPSPPQQPSAPAAALIIVKASAATLAAGAKISGMTAQLVALQPASVNTAALPTDDCGGGTCDWWKEEQACGDDWFCEESAADRGEQCLGAGCTEAAEPCLDSNCDDLALPDCTGPECGLQWVSDCSATGCDFTITDPACSGSACEPVTCTDNGCGWDIGFDQDPVMCALGESATCTLAINPVQNAAGTFFVSVDAFSADTPSTYTLEIDAIDSEGITVQSAGGDLSALAPQYQQYASDPIVIDGTTWFTLLYPTALASQVQEALAAIPGIGVIAIDPCWLKWKAPNDPYYHSAGSWGQSYADQWALHRIGFSPQGKNAWDELGKNPGEVIVAVIDSGIDWNHRDLAWQNIWFNSDEIADNGLDDDGNGFIDDRIGWDFWAGDNRPWDEDGHGTIISGIIAARVNNGIGIAGINPSARIMPLRVMNAFGHTRASFVARALVYAVDNGARVVNLSVGGAGESTVFRAAVDYAESKGVLVVAAAGNEAAELNGILPGAHSSVLTVAALDTADQRAAFSNYGTQVDLAAPGVDVLSLRARFTDTMLGLGDIEYRAGQATIGEDKRYYRSGGTSFAAPFVTGVASLLLAENPRLQAADLRRVLRNSAADVAEPGWDRLTGYGRLDATAALQADPDYYIEARIHGLEITQQGGKTVVVVSGTADADRFASAQVLLGQGSAPDRWRRVSTLKKAQVDDTLAAIPAAALQGGPKHFTVRLIVKHRNGSTREVRFGLDLG